MTQRTMVVLKMHKRANSETGQALPLLLLLLLLFVLLFVSLFVA
jgi:hypothetical protein